MPVLEVGEQFRSRWRAWYDPPETPVAQRHTAICDAAAAVYRRRLADKPPAVGSHYDEGYPGFEVDVDVMIALPGFRFSLMTLPLRRERRTGRGARCQAAVLRDIFGNPFRPVTFDPAWRTSTVVALARQMYESRDFVRDADPGGRAPGRRVRQRRHPRPLPRAGAARPRVLGRRSGAGQGVASSVASTSSRHSKAAATRLGEQRDVFRAHLILLLVGAVGGVFFVVASIGLGIAAVIVPGGSRDWGWSIVDDIRSVVSRHRRPVGHCRSPVSHPRNLHPAPGSRNRIPDTAA